MSSLEFYWYRRNKIVWLLLPFSWLYCLLTVVRRKLYQTNIKKSYAAEVPVVVIGNIVAGGSGKTPLLIGLCEFILAKGYKVGVVSRGYGGSFSGIKQVTEKDDAAVVGDEPLMIHQRTGVPVVVSADRVAAVSYLLSHDHCDIVLSDDGLQHYRMQRSLELAVIDAERKFGNGFCLPAGPLREQISRLNDVDLIIYNGKPAHVYAATNNKTDACAEQASDVSECSYQLKVTKIQRLNNDESRELSGFAGRRVHAVAAIGNPLRFFRQLEAQGLSVQAHAFPDHYQYQQEDFSGWSSDCIIMTEKDAVKCRHLQLADAWVVSVNSEFSTMLISRLEALLLPLLTKHQVQ